MSRCRHGVAVRGVAIISTLMASGAGAQAGLLDAVLGNLPRDPQALADAIVEDVVAIRGLEFQRDISVSNQSRAEFERYIASEMDRTLPADRAGVYGRVVNKLGLYRGPIIDDMAGMVTLLATSQAAAYYNPDESAFYVLLADAPLGMLAPIYAHELYHGMQDQYWDLDVYLLDGVSDGLNDDEMLARQAVVEGEATYVMTLWLLREMSGQVPSGFALDVAVNLQTQMDSNALRELAASGIVPGGLDPSLEASLAAMDDIPLFMLETMLGAYIKGMGFVHHVVRGDWDRAARLYTDPPSSSEQILHPEKWLERDDPVAIEFPDLSGAESLEGWTLLDSNVIGEFQWRIIFDEFGMSESSNAAAAGWDGDRFAVLERGEATLLLLYTTWDSEADAEEFASAYSGLLAIKYPDGSEATAIEVRGRDVLVVEGGAAEQLGERISLLANSRKIE
ncbi:MAG TPA: hypothetical protein VIV64_12225 [Gammaproteobacteria bacterium]